MHLRIAIKEWRPITYSEPGYEGNKERISGFTGFLFDTLFGTLNVTYSLEYGDGKWGKLINDSWTGIIGSLSRNEADISNPTALDHERLQQVDYSTPVLDNHITILSRVSFESDSDIPNDDILRQFSELPILYWYSIVIITLGTMIVTYFLEKITLLPKMENSKLMLHIYLRWTSALQIANTSHLFRLLLGIFLICMVVCVTFINCNITGTRVLGQSVELIDSVEDLANNRDIIPYLYRDGISARIFENPVSYAESKVAERKRFLSTRSLVHSPNAFAQLKRNKAALIRSYIGMITEVYQICPSHADLHLHIATKEILSMPQNILFSKLLQASIKMLLIKRISILSGSGLFDIWLERVLTKKNLSCIVNYKGKFGEKMNKENEFTITSVKHVVLLFVYYALFTLIAFLVLIIELIRYYYVESVTIHPGTTFTTL